MPLVQLQQSLHFSYWAWQPLTHLHVTDIAKPWSHTFLLRHKVWVQDPKLYCLSYLHYMISFTIKYFWVFCIKCAYNLQYLIVCYKISCQIILSQEWCSSQTQVFSAKSLNIALIVPYNTYNCGYLTHGTQLPANPQCLQT